VPPGINHPVHRSRSGCQREAVLRSAGRACGAGLQRYQARLRRSA
jgi:hypothetical protein